MNVKKSPLKGLTSINVTSDFGYRKFSYKNPSGKVVTVEGNHSGIDLTPGSEIVPIAKGKVTAVRKDVTGYSESLASGNYVTLYHGNNVYSTYCHLDHDSVSVNVGDVVDTNKVLGTTKIKTTGWSTGLHLHFGIKVNGVFVDPKDYLLGNKVIADYVVPVVVVTPVVTGNTYKVVKGDTLSGIGAKLGIDWHLIYNANKAVIGANPNVIRVGQVFVLPGAQTAPQPTYYTVQAGDNLSKIAKNFKTTWQKLYEANQSVIGSNPNRIMIGQRLVIK